VIVRDLVANQAHNVGHRRLVRDEVWCRMQFRDEADLVSFAKTLRWTAFRFEAPKQAAQPTAEAPKADSKTAPNKR
jgi:hypothetical protein